MNTFKERLKYFSGGQNDEQKKIKKELCRRRLTEVFKKIGFVDAKLEYNLNQATPLFCIDLLKYPHQRMFLKLRNKIRSSPKSWLQEFIKSYGLYELLKCIENLCKKQSNIMNSIRMSQCISCIKEIMNLKYGMNAVLDICILDSNYVAILGKGNKFKKFEDMSKFKQTNISFKACMTSSQMVKQGVLELLSALCSYSFEGHQFCMNMLEFIKVSN